MTDANGTEQQATAAGPSAVEAARAEIARLEKKLGEMAGRREHNRAARAAAGLPANSTDGRNLADLRSEALRLDLEAQDLEAWKVAAERRLAEAIKAEEIAGDVELAKRRLELADLLRRGGVALDQGFSAERFEGWNGLLDELIATKLSCESAAPAPNGQQRRVFATIAIKTMLQGVPLIAREFESVAPSSRTTFAKISADWATSSERSARAYLEGAGIKLEAAE
jgi:hypothetical protein